MPNIYYRLPVDLECVGLALCNESPDTIFYLDLFTGGVFSLLMPGDRDWERVGEGFDHSVECSFRRTPERYLGIDAPTARHKKAIVEEFAGAITDVEVRGRVLLAAADATPFAAMKEALAEDPARLWAWRNHLEKALAAAAAEFLEENGISTEPSPRNDQVLDATDCVI